jgi:type I restriction enzyme R subunit
MPFELFDPQAEIRITSGHLPHWYQPGVTYFITFRTADSVPVALAETWVRRREEWLRNHGIDPNAPQWAVQLRGLPDVERQFHNTFSREFMEYFDKGYGACVLKRPELARIVGDSLLHFDGQQYLLSDFVVMPNHVHVLVCLLGETDLEKQCYSWKKYTANLLNRALGRRGRFWQEESFDHLVRSPEQFDYLHRYIADNPEKAGLRPGEYLLWQRAGLHDSSPGTK